MSLNYEENPNLQNVEVVYEHEVTADDLRKSTSRLIAIEKEKGMINFLVDTTGAKFAASFTDLYSLPTTQFIEEKADRLGRVAILLPTNSEAREAVQFYENVCKNRGWKVLSFSERQEAISWLTG